MRKLLCDSGHSTGKSHHPGNAPRKPGLCMTEVLFSVNARARRSDARRPVPGIGPRKEKVVPVARNARIAAARRFRDRGRCGLRPVRRNLSNPELRMVARNFDIRHSRRSVRQQLNAQPAQRTRVVHANGLPEAFALVVEKATNAWPSSFLAINHATATSRPFALMAGPLIGHASIFHASSCTAVGVSQWPPAKRAV